MSAFSQFTHSTIGRMVVLAAALGMPVQAAFSQKTAAPARDKSSQVDQKIEPQVSVAAWQTNASNPAFRAGQGNSHAILTIGKYNLVGMPADPNTGAPLAIWNAQGAVLRVFVQSQNKSDQVIALNGFTPLGQMGTYINDGLYDKGEAAVLATALDTAAGINSARIPYVEVSPFVTKASTNANAAFMAMAMKLGADISAITGNLASYGYTLPGLDAGQLVMQIATSPRNGTHAYSTAEANGATEDQLVSQFNASHVHPGVAPAPGTSPFPSRPKGSFTHNGPPST